MARRKRGLPAGPALDERDLEHRWRRLRTWGLAWDPEGLSAADVARHQALRTATSNECVRLRATGGPIGQRVAELEAFLEDLGLHEVVRSARGRKEC